MIELSRIQALGILAEASDHDDPHWEQCMEMVIGYENLDEDSILPGFDDVLRVIGVTEEEIELVNRQAWRERSGPKEDR